MRKPYKVISWNYPNVRINGWVFYCWPWLDRNPVLGYARTDDRWDFQVLMGGIEISYNNFDGWGSQ